MREPTACGFVNGESQQMCNANGYGYQRMRNEIKIFHVREDRMRSVNGMLKTNKLRIKSRPWRLPNVLKPLFALVKKGVRVVSSWTAECLQFFILCLKKYFELACFSKKTASVEWATWCAGQQWMRMTHVIIRTWFSAYICLLTVVLVKRLVMNVCQVKPFELYQLYVCLFQNPLFTYYKECCSDYTLVYNVLQT